MYFMITKTSPPTIQIWKFKGDFWEKITLKLPLMEALVGRQIVFQTWLKGGDFKFEFKKGRTFIPVHFPLVACLFTRAHSQHNAAFLKGKWEDNENKWVWELEIKKKSSLWRPIKFSESVRWQQKKIKVGPRTVNAQQIEPDLEPNIKVKKLCSETVLKLKS